MPSKDLGVGVDILPPLNLGSLKGHKILPRRKIISDDTDYGRPIRQERRTRHKSEQISYSSAERIKSWIPEASPIQVIPVVGKPLTPPINFRDDFQSWINDVALRGRKLTRTPTSHSPAGTPLAQQSPPTPETTPPKSYQVRAAASRSSTRGTSDGRTDSFKTAQESQTSDEESQPLDSPSNRPAREKWLRETGLSKNRDIGLGLGLEAEDDGNTLGATTPRHVDKRRDFGTFDGAWDASDEDRHESGSQGGHSSATSVPYDRRPHRRTKMTEPPVLDSPTLGQEDESSVKKSLSLRQRVEKSRYSLPTASSEMSTEQTHWPLKEDYFDLETELRDMSNKRLSQASTASTVVEAMVIQSPPRRRQTLRHTVKMEDMNSTTPPPASNRNSLNSTEHSSVRRRLRRSGSPDPELRKSYASTNTTRSLGSNPANAQQDLVTTTAYPNRISSLQSSASDSKKDSRSSPNARQQASRPTTAPEESVSYFDVPSRHGRRTMSIVVQPSRASKNESKLEKGADPAALAQLSSPSVPTSSEISRTASAISAGIGTRYDPPTPAEIPRATLYLSDPPDDHNLSVDRSMVEWSAIRPRSTLVTPFSLRSARSSTPGTLEVNEATAISIYPHTNKSILVIQQMAGGSDFNPREQSAIIAGNANIALPGSITPIIHHHSPPREVLNSPLQNPRDAPQPPDLRVIAPTPANGRPSSEATSPVPITPAKTNRFSAPITSIKRAISARRLSDHFVSPLTRTFSLRGTASTHRRRRTLDDDIEPGSKLHPFWRPRGFWDDVNDSDSDEEFGNTGFLTGSRRPSQSTQEVSQRRTAPLTHRLKASLGLPRSPHRSRRFSLSSETDQDLYEFVNAKNGLDHEGSKRDGVIIQPKVQADKERQPVTVPRRTASLTRRLRGSLHLRRPTRPQRPSSISHLLDHDSSRFIPAIGQEDEVQREDVRPRRTMSLTRRLTGSLRLPRREWRERPMSISAPLHPEEDGSDKPSIDGREGSRSDAIPRRTVSLSRRWTESFGLPHRIRQERPMSISAPLHPYEKSSTDPKVNGMAEWKSDVLPRRTMSLNHGSTGSVQHPARPPRPLSMSSPIDHDDYDFVPPDSHREQAHCEERVPRPPVQLIGFKAFAAKMERRREAREEGKREERRRWLTDRIRRVGTDEDIARTEHFKREMGGW